MGAELPERFGEQAVEVGFHLAEQGDVVRTAIEHLTGQELHQCAALLAALELLERLAHGAPEQVFEGCVRLCGDTRDYCTLAIHHAADLAFEHLQVELILAAEVVIDGGDVAVCGPREIADAGAIEAFFAEKAFGGIQQPILHMAVLGICGRNFVFCRHVLRP